MTTENEKKSQKFSKSNQGAMTKERKKRRSKNLVIDNETGEFSGLRRIIDVGGAYYVGVPREFVEKHCLKENGVFIVGNGIMKVIPRKSNEKKADPSL